MLFCPCRWIAECVHTYVCRSIGRSVVNVLVACVVAAAAVVDVCFITFVVSWYRESCFHLLLCRLQHFAVQ